TRTAPAITTTGAASTTQGQLELNTGFRLPEDPGDPWRGIIERKRAICDGVDLVDQPVEAVDRFHEVLDAKSAAARRILTVVPDDYRNAGGHLVGDNPGLPAMSPSGGG
ncbi:MAG: hypothetical protein GWN07_32660, partial [Actinobacteria bacterium]|nr:hypothetical protein [Actinomycetota bacterium]NIS35724.1 hypothetical protein [Actinomycetota bacterium]NIU70194.1 hypothetical protein [Actinomycetota bacterium]NIW32080.1 hypothetical protein [Actinomycetota bacterium]NIX24305.1 hypothetical protein [Actinomycetota bacterium]